MKFLKTIKNKLIVGASMMAASASSHAGNVFSPGDQFGDMMQGLIDFLNGTVVRAIAVIGFIGAMVLRAMGQLDDSMFNTVKNSLIAVALLLTGTTILDLVTGGII